MKELFDLTYEVSGKKIGAEGVLTVLREELSLELPVTYRAAVEKKEGEEKAAKK